MVANVLKGADGLDQLMSSPNLIRNICIMAHVDHGKTTLADALIASNGIINQRQAGKIKYMDSRKDEIERGITMKSSCVSLTYPRDELKYIVNLIDSPGHVDFSSEVSTAVRLCDGTIIVVDVIEGVCAQTKVVLRQAWLENIQPVLVLNKIDRLILEMKMSPLDAYYHIAQVLEQVNAYMGELHNMEVLGRMAERSDRKKSSERERRASECFTAEVEDIFASWGIDDIDDTDLYFSPNHGNVVFSSAYDGWGFSIHHFAEQYAVKLGMRREILQKTLWGDYFITNRGGEKRIMKGARDKRKNTLFVTLILENMYKLYDVVMIRRDKDEILKLAECLGVKMSVTIAKSTDTRYKVKFLCSKWLPLAPAILDMVVDHLPAACDVNEERARKLMCSATRQFSNLPIPTQSLCKYYSKCSSCEDAPLIVYVSKMYAVQRKQLQNLQKGNLQKVKSGGIMSDEEIAAKRELIRKRREVPAVNNNAADGVQLNDETINLLSGKLSEANVEQQKLEETETDSEEDNVFIAFARVFSGTLHPGQKVYVLGPKHDPRDVIDKLQDDGGLTEAVLEESEHIQTCKIDDVYLLVGRELQLLEHAPAGSVVGVTGLQDHIIKSATLSSTCACPPFTELTHHSTPILRVAVEPQDPRQFSKLRIGLKTLNQADPCVQVLLQDSGEYVLVTAGEVHLQRCIDDLEERYARIKLHVSSPIVPFRETIISAPKVDRLNEAIEGENVNTKQDDDKDPLGRVKVSNRSGVLVVRAAPLPAKITQLLDSHSTLLKFVCESSFSDTLSINHENGDHNNFNEDNFTGTLNRQTITAIQTLKMELHRAFKEAGDEWEMAIDEIWCFGPHYSGSNILLNRIKSYDRPSVWERNRTIESSLGNYDRNFVSGFQLATACGPLCEEPMSGVCFIVEEWELPSCEDNLSGQVISLVKDTLRKAFEAQNQRLVWAMYSCAINVTADVIGKMYTVIGKRHGRIIDGDITEGSTAWNITAYLPVVESLNFANELRKSTSGEAMPQLVFSHWETLEMDPFWEPQTTEELAHWGEKSDTGNLARKYINDARKRKGLFIDNKIVEFAEKQRTLSKNK